MGFLKRLWKSFSTEDPTVAGGDREAQAILREEFPAAAEDADTEFRTAQAAHWETVGPAPAGTFDPAGPIGMGEGLEPNVGGFELAETEDDDGKSEDNAESE